MTVQISKPAINLREELASLRNQGGLPKEDKLYVGELITNGTFDNGTTGWTPSNSSLSVVNNKLRITNSTAGTYGDAQQYIPVVAGKTYKANIEVTDGTGDLYWIVSGQGVNSGYFNGSNTSSYTFTPTSSGNVQINARVTELGTASVPVHSGDYADIDNVSVQEVGENFVTNGTFDTDLTGWTVVNPNGQTVEQTGGKLRLATTVASDYVDANQLLTNTTSGKTYTLSLDYTKTSGNGFSLVINGVQTNHTASGHIVRTFVSDGSDFIQIKRFNVSDNLFDNVTVTEGNHQVIQSIPYGYDVKDVYIDGELAREGEAYDYQVQTDGINQWLKPTVEPTATTETVVIGVRNGS